MHPSLEQRLRHVPKLLAFQHRTAEEHYLIHRASRTADLIRTLWRGAGKARRESDFLTLLVLLGWNNEGKKRRGRKSTRQWRNAQIARYLGLSFASRMPRAQREEALAVGLSDSFASFTKPTALEFVRGDTGITHYRNSLRSETLEFVRTNADRIAPLFEEVTAARKWNEQKVLQLVDKVSGLGQIKGTSLLNGMSPTLACLAGGLRGGFPIINAKTRHSPALSAKNDSERAKLLFNMIGPRRIKNVFELDVYVTAFLKRHKWRPAK